MRESEPSPKIDVTLSGSNSPTGAGCGYHAALLPGKGPPTPRAGSGEPAGMHGVGYRSGGLPVRPVQALVMRSVVSAVGGRAAADAAGRIVGSAVASGIGHNDRGADLVVWELESFQDGVGPVYWLRIG